MTAGVLLFAYNNDHIDYVKLAEWSAERIHRHLDLPVGIVTDAQTVDSVFDYHIITDLPGSSGRYFADYDQLVEWKNGNRSSAFDLSPWDTTLVLDADYVVASDQLLQLLDSQQDFLTPANAYDVTGMATFDDLNVFGKFALPICWATVLFFRKTHRIKMLFDTVDMVRRNWHHYRALYQISRSAYRNDFAFAIAANLTHGQVLNWPSVPWSLASVVPEHRLAQVDADCFSVHYQTPDAKHKRTQLNQIDFHAMGKRDLGAIIGN